MNYNSNPLLDFVDTFYEGDVGDFREDLNSIIFYMHYVESEVVSPKEIQEACFILKSLIDSCKA